MTWAVYERLQDIHLAPHNPFVGQFSVFLLTCLLGLLLTDYKTLFPSFRCWDSIIRKNSRYLLLNARHTRVTNQYAYEFHVYFCRKLGFLKQIVSGHCTVISKSHRIKTVIIGSIGVSMSIRLRYMNFFGYSPIIWLSLRCTRVVQTIFWENTKWTWIMNRRKGEKI